MSGEVAEQGLFPYDLSRLTSLSLEIVGHMNSAERYMDENLLNRAEFEWGKVDIELRKFINLANIKRTHPLSNAEAEIQLAEKMIRDRSYETAKTHLRKAKSQLKKYFGIKDQFGNEVTRKSGESSMMFGESGRKQMDELDKTIIHLIDSLENSVAKESLNDFWKLMTRWYIEKGSFANQGANTDQ